MDGCCRAVTARTISGFTPDENLQELARSLLMGVCFDWSVGVVDFDVDDL